ncbi:MAG: hypothetical protein J1E42_06585 [Akkermansiaceae bacterium]|nr:hypothetical protein [Akkermansiaceae bacterium]
MNESPKELIQPHGVLAACELLEDLKSQPELKKYVLSDLWLDGKQETSIQAKCNTAGICIAVGLAEDRLPHPNDEKQGGTLNVGLALYVFSTMQLAITKARVKQQQRVWLTALHYANRFKYTVGLRTIKARLTQCAEVDLKEISTFADKITAQALMLEIPIGI